MRLCRLRKVFLAFGLAVFLSAGTALAAPILSENSHGHDVLKLQRELKRTGYLADEPDGIFGSRTKSAVLAFQRAQSLKETGVVDRETWSRLQKQPAREENAAAPVPASPVPDGAGVKPADAPGKEMRPALEPRIKKAPESAPFLQRAKVAAVIATAKKYIGTPYKFGGTTPKAFDCSGYLQYVFQENGMMLPRTADEQFKLGRNAKTAELEAGDLVFFETYEKGASHCGIYLGGGKFIHASTSKGVRIDELSGDYWNTHYYGGKHIVR
ncbi:NlpC/P60 family protein [uncultured Selenomonas sp.]|uniref:C40 family peptidase n=1 Tax=uncultured Selenomonas sp. TaxID=159275 RepID=UPI00261131C0|nr:NlpC/P60 family protein [uncultured Selenomonas sp.]